MTTNPNVKLVLLYRLLDGVGTGIWGFTVIVTYISLCEQGFSPDEKVGLAEALRGTCLALAALIAAWIARSARRDTILRTSATLNVLAIAVTCYSTITSAYRFQLLCVGLALWGLSQGGQVVMDALFADSIPTGQRSQMYTLQYVVALAAMALGPALPTLYLYNSGNVWSIETLRNCILAGNLLALLPAACCFFFDDSKALGQESRGVLEQPEQQQEPGPSSPGGGAAQQPSEQAAPGTMPVLAVPTMLSAVKTAGSSQALPDSSSGAVPSTQPLPKLHEAVERARSSHCILIDDDQLDDSPAASGAAGSGAAAGELTAAGSSADATGATAAAGTAAAAAAAAAAAGVAKEAASHALVWSPGSSAATPYESVDGDAFSRALASHVIDDPGTPSASEGTPHSSSARLHLLHGPAAGSPGPARSHLPASQQQHKSRLGAALGPAAAMTSAVHPAPAAALLPSSSSSSSSSRRRCYCLRPGLVPYLLSTSDLLMGLASGMTLKFLPLFLKDEVHLDPASVNIIFGVAPLVLGLLAVVGQALSRAVGRVQTILVYKAVGIVQLQLIAMHPEWWTSPPLIVSLFLCRTAVMNATAPLQKSILMDYAGKAQRPMWGSLEALAAFGWSGSAALGGWLIQQYGFDVNFTITAAVQAVAWCVLLLLLPLVPVKEAAVVMAGQQPGPGRSSSSSSRQQQEQDELAEPLLLADEENRS